MSIRNTLSILGLSIAVIACAESPPEQPPAPSPVPAEQAQVQTPPPYQFPYDLILPESATLEQKQALVNEYVWREFIALNWPANPAQPGTPDSGKTLSDAGPRVWETFKPTQEIFLADGKKPEPFNSPNEIPEICKGVAGGSANMKVLQQVTKDPLLNATGQAFAGADGFLVDQQGVLAHYENSNQ